MYRQRSEASGDRRVPTTKRQALLLGGDEGIALRRLRQDSDDLLRPTYFNIFNNPGRAFGSRWYARPIATAGVTFSCP